MHSVHVEVSATKGLKPADASIVAQWVAEALNDPSNRDTNLGITVHSITVEETDA